MTASDYIQLLELLIAKYGDLECVDSEDVPMDTPEEVEGVFVLADKTI